MGWTDFPELVNVKYCWNEIKFPINPLRIVLNTLSKDIPYIWQNDSCTCSKWLEINISITEQNGSELTDANRLPIYSILWIILMGFFVVSLQLTHHLLRIFSCFEVIL